MESKLTFVKTLFINVIAQRSYTTSVTTKKKPSLYSVLSPLRNPEQSQQVLDDWVSKGNKVSVAELQHIIRDLRKRKHFTPALQISEWMIEKEKCKFRTTEHAMHMDLIGKVHGFVSAEEYFGKLGEEDKDYKTHGALLNCYGRHLQTDKALAQLRKMQEMGIANSALCYNAIMSLYSELGQHEKVPGVLAEMKENNVSPNIFTYRACINSCSVRSDPEGIDEVLKEVEAQPHIVMDWNTYAVVADSYIKAGQTDRAIEALKKSEKKLESVNAGQTDRAIEALKKSEKKLESVNAHSYNFLITLYTSVGSKEAVLRLWSLEKKACKKLINNNYICILASLVKLGELEEAEKVLKEWETSSNSYDFRVPQAVIVGFTQHGLFGKAEALLEDLMHKGKPTGYNCWETIAAGYADKGEMEKAFKCMNRALSVSKEGRKKLNDSTITTLLSWLGDEGSIEDSEAFVGSLRKVIPVNREMYHALLEAYIRGGEDVNSVVDRMKADELDVDDEQTRSILEKRCSDSPIA